MYLIAGSFDLLPNAKIVPIGKNINKLLQDKKYLDEILDKGVEKADNLATKKITEIKSLVGF